MFVFENFEPAFNFSRDRVPKTPISHAIIGYQSLDDLYEVVDESVDGFRQQLIGYQKEGHEINIEGYGQVLWDWSLFAKDLCSQECMSVGGGEMTLGML